MKTKRKMFMKEFGISILIFVLAITSFLVSAAYLKPYLANATEVTSDGIEIITTNNSNIEFSTYLVNNDGEKIKALNAAINENTYLYVDITVLNEGYFNGAISLNNSNFRFVEEVENEKTEEDIIKVNEGVSEITENSISLEKINAGETKTIKVAVEPIIGDTITLNNLTVETEVILSGEYVNSKNIEKNKYEEIIGTGSVELRWVSSEDIDAEIETELLTNSIYEIEEQEKRIVQVLVNSRITDNSYPVYSSTIKITVPENVEEIEVSSRSTDSTNSDIEFGTENYVYNEEEKTVEITAENTNTEKISWNKECYDTFVVTYVFDVNEYITEESIDVNSEITTYDSKKITAEEKVELKQTDNIDGVITYNVSTEDTSIYKGKLYAREDKEYSVTNEINVNYLNIVESIKLNCNEATYLAGEQEGTANIIYISSKIKKENFIEIFGEDGYIVFKDEKGNETTITNETETDEEGNITINYEEETKSIEIRTSEPKVVGTLEIEQTKKIEDTGYTRQTIEAMTEIKETITGTVYAKWSEDEDETTEEARITLEETKTEASLKIDTSTISTTAESQTITLCAILDSSDETKNLYKNPAVRITLPEEIEVISAQYAVISKNGLTVGERTIKENENGQYEITIYLNGEQVEYDTSRGGTRIYFKLEIETSTLTPTKVDKIEMAYTNEYTNEAKLESTEINFESQYGLMIYNELTNYGEEGEKLVTIDKETATTTIEKNAVSKEISVGTAIINNYGTQISNVEIIGSVPSRENSTFLSSINSVATDKEGVEILYSTKADISADDESWGEYTEDCVSYKISIEKMEAEEVIKLSVASTIPADLSYNEEGYFKTTTICTYNEQQEENTSTMLLATETTDAIVNKEITENGLSVEVAAYLGDTSIAEEDTVYEGETIRYEVTITNNTGVDYTNVEIKAEQTNGYVWDNVLKEVYNPYYDTHEELGLDAYYDENYYEITDYNEKEIITLESFAHGESYSFKYESSTYLLDDENLKGTETYGTIKILSEESNLEEEIKTIENEIIDAELQINVKDGYTSDITYISGEAVESLITIKNLTDEELKNVEVKILFAEHMDPAVSSNKEEAIESIEELDEDDDDEDDYDDYYDEEDEDEDDDDYDEDDDEDEEEDDDDEVIETDSNFTLVSEETTENGEIIRTYNIAELEVGETYEINALGYTDSTFEGDEIEVYIIASATTESNNNYISNKLSRTVEDNSKDIGVTQEGNYEDGTKIEPLQDVLIDGDNISITATVTNNEDEELSIDINYNIDSNINIETAKITSLTYDNEDIAEEMEENNNYLDLNEETIEKNETITIEITGTINAYDTDYIENILRIIDNSTYKVTSDTYKVQVDKTTDDETNGKDKGILYEEESSSSNLAQTYDADDDSTEEENNNEDNNDEYSSDTEGNNSENNDDYTNGTNENNENEDNNIENASNSSEENQNTNTYTVSGIAWLDSDQNGVRDSQEERITDLEVVAINASNEDIYEATLTDSNGEYMFTLEEGIYIIVFLYDNTLYTTTLYQADEAESTTNSDAIEESIEIEGEEVTAGVTDTISLTGNLTNIDIGLVTKEKFDLNISKYVNKITISNEDGTKEYEQKEGTTLAKAEIKSKYINSSIVEIEYKIQITNSGEIAGYANMIVDDIPANLEFDETLNSSWYIEDDKLYNTSLANEKIEPGETKELTLILTKSMTESNIGLINNNAEIETTSNDSGIEDETENKAQANVIISLSTGATKYAIGTIAILIIATICGYIINKKLLQKRI